jgi:hypothetical protein
MGIWLPFPLDEPIGEQDVDKFTGTGDNFFIYS